MYVPWSTPEIYTICTQILQIVVKNYSKTSSTSAISTTFSQELSLCLIDYFPILIDYCRQRSIQNKWKEKGYTHIPYITIWLITHIQHKELIDNQYNCLSLSLPMTLRICDDWNAFNIWLGASGLIHLLENCNPTDLRNYKDLIKEIIQRILLSSRHPLLVHLVSYIYALMGPTLYGPCPAYDLSKTSNPLMQVLRTGTGGTSTVGKTGVPIGPFDGPYDILFQDILRSLGMVNSSHLQYSLLSSYNVICLQMKEYTARYLQTIIPILSKLILESYDSRVICASIHMLRSLFVAVPDRFTLPSTIKFHAFESVNDNYSTDIRSIVELIDILVTTMLECHNQMINGKYILPVVNEDGVLSYPGATKQEVNDTELEKNFESSSCIEIIDTNAQLLIQQYIQVLFKDLWNLNPTYIQSIYDTLSSTSDKSIVSSMIELMKYTTI